MTTRIGLLGAAGIARAAILEPVRRRDDVVVSAVASRSGSKAYAEEHDIARAPRRSDRRRPSAIRPAPTSR
jgi:predicted dehydrogenase